MCIIEGSVPRLHIRIMLVLLSSLLLSTENDAEGSLQTKHDGINNSSYWLKAVIHVARYDIGRVNLVHRNNEPLPIVQTY